jgi:hypothetical protein
MVTVATSFPQVPTSPQARASPQLPAGPKATSGCRSCLITLVLFFSGLGGCGVMYWDKIKAALSAIQGARLPMVSQATMKNQNVTPPVEVAYIHFLDEAHRRLGGQLQVGSPVQTPARIEVSVTADGKPESLVVIEKANSGHQAKILVGPKDAGAVRSYSLSLGPNGWTIDSFQDLDG